MYTRTNTPLGDNTPSPSTHKGGVLNVFEQTLRQSKTQIIEEKSERNRESRRERGRVLKNRKWCMGQTVYAGGRLGGVCVW